MLMSPFVHDSTVTLVVAEEEGSLGRAAWVVPRVPQLYCHPFNSPSLIVLCQHSGGPSQRSGMQEG